MTHPESLEYEAPEADAAEQAVNADPSEDEGTVSQDLEAPEWDAQEQSRTVQLEDDDYR
jgi:uncharacterized protein YciI